MGWGNLSGLHYLPRGDAGVWVDDRSGVRSESTSRKIRGVSLSFFLFFFNKDGMFFVFPRLHRKPPPPPMIGAPCKHGS